MRQRLYDGGEALQRRIGHAYQGVADAWGLGIAKIPAVVIDRRYVVYGEPDVPHAVARIDAYRSTLRHYVPDAVVSSYSNTGKNPWLEVRAMSMPNPPPNDQSRQPGDECQSFLGGIAATTRAAEDNGILSLVFVLLNLPSEALIAALLPEAGEVLDRVLEARGIFRGDETPDAADGLVAQFPAGCRPVVEDGVTALLDDAKADAVYRPIFQGVAVQEDRIAESPQFTGKRDRVRGPLLSSGDLLRTLRKHASQDAYQEPEAHNRAIERIDLVAG